MVNRFVNFHRFEYQDPNSVGKLIRYITRTRPAEDRLNELVSYGFNFGYSYNKPIECIIHEFEFVQKYYKAEGSLMCHYAIQISDDNFRRIGYDYDRLNSYAVDCCNYLFKIGHQACYAIHYSKRDCLHIHLAINTINFMTGKKLRQYPTELQRNVEYPLDALFTKYYLPCATIDDIA